MSASHAGAAQAVWRAGRAHPGPGVQGGAARKAAAVTDRLIHDWWRLPCVNNFFGVPVWHVCFILILSALSDL